MAKKYIRIQESGVRSQNLLVQDAESYQLLIERMELLESMVGICKSLAEFEQGKGMPLEEAFQHLQDKQLRHDTGVN